MSKVYFWQSIEADMMQNQIQKDDEDESPMDLTFVH